MARAKPKEKMEFSKFVLALVMATYFFGVVYVSGVILLLIKRGMVDIGTLVTALLTFIGAPTATAIGYYFWKAKNENMQKHRQAVDGQPEMPIEQPIENGEEQSI